MSRTYGRSSRRRFLGAVGGTVAAAGLAYTGQSGLLSRPAFAQADVEITVDAADNRGPIANPAWFTNESLSAWRDERPLPAATVADLRRNFDIRTTRIFLNPHEGPAEYNGYIEQVASYSKRIFVCYNGLPGKPAGEGQQWEDLVTTMLLDHKARYPGMEYIEPWNEPNHPDVGGGLTPAEYFEYFAATYRAINTVNDELNPDVPLKVGGPVMTGTPGDYITEFLDLYAADDDSGKRLDFVSFHDYGSLNAPRRVLGWKAMVRNWLSDRGIPDVPVVVSEYGPYGGSNGTDDFEADRLVQACCMAAMGRYYALGNMDMPMHWVLNHRTNDRKDIYVDDTEKSRTPYGNIVAMQQLQKADRVTTNITPSVDDNGIGTGAISTIGDTGIAVLCYNYQAQDGTASSNANVTVTNLPPELAEQPIRVRRYLVDTAHNNYDYDQTVVGLTADSDEVHDPAESITHEVALEPNAVALLLVEPAPL